jgi:hypothetical protein
MVIVCGCKEKTHNSETEKKYFQVTISEENLTPTVDISSFVLITNNESANRIEAMEIMKIKRKFPLAMQGKDSTLFNEILAKNFTFRADDEFFNRADYIRDRVNGTWTIDTVRYQNLALQFFGDIAVLTYRNILNGTDDNGKPDIEKYSWADIFVKEDGKWKIGSVHNVDARIEYPGE